MVTEELISYIKSQLDAGIDRNEIVKILKAQGGWGETDVADAFAKIGQVKALNTEPQKAGNEVRKFSKQDPFVSEGQDPLTAQGARNVTQATDQTAQEVHNPNSILGQVAGQKKGGGGKKTVSAIIIVIVLLGVLAGAAYGYFTYFANPKPLDVLLEATAKSMEVTTAKEKGTFKFDLNIDVDDKDNTAMQDLFTKDGMSFNFLILSDMLYDISDAANQKIDGSLTFGFDGKTGLMKAGFDGTADIKMVDNIIYLQLRDTTPFMELDLSEYEDRWIEIDLENIMPGVGIDIEELMAMQTEQQEEYLEVLQELLNDSEIVKIINRSGKIENATDTNGNKEYHLTFQVSKEDWKILTKKAFEAFKEMAITMMEEEMQNTPYVSYSGYEEPDMEEMFAEIESELNSEEAGKVFEILENLTVEMWITKDTMLTRRSVVLLDVGGIKIEDEYSGEMTIDVVLSAESETDYNVSVDVTPPTDATPFQEFMEEVSGETGQKEKKASIKADLMTIRPSAELYYDDNKGSYGVQTEVSEDACSEENTMFDDSLISSSLMSVLWELEGNETLVCGIGDDGQSYVISAELGNDLWFCIDSMGAAFETDLPLAEGDITCPEKDKVDEYLFDEGFEEIDW